MKEPFDFGMRLKQLRAEKGLSQADVAKRVHLTKQTISGYESNTAMPSVESLIDLALLFNVSTDYLLGLNHRKVLYIDGFDEESISHISKMLDILKDNFKPK